jgi:hypothetical protein
VQTGHLTIGAASFRIVKIRGDERRVGRWATGRSLLANRRLGTCTIRVLGCQPDRMLPTVTVPAALRVAGRYAAERQRRSVGRRCIRPALLTIVSLEAIFLSTFAMISQNRHDEAHSDLADRETVELMGLSN